MFNELRRERDFYTICRVLANLMKMPQDEMSLRACWSPEDRWNMLHFKLGLWLQEYGCSEDVRVIAWSVFCDCSIEEAERRLNQNS